jgi:hypothetical protein
MLPDLLPVNDERGLLLLPNELRPLLFTGLVDRKNQLEAGGGGGADCGERRREERELRGRGAG